MPIQNTQLIAWGSPPSQTEMAKIQRSKTLIEEALKKHLDIDGIKKNFSLSSFDYEVYLQGSYANSTNIRFDSDVDVVVQLNSTYYFDTSQLSETQAQQFEKSTSNSTYNFVDFKKTLFRALQQEFGTDVEYANKCIKIKGNSYRVPIDVVPCFEHRLYKSYLSYFDARYVSGIKFLDTSTNEAIVNFPKVHLKNCTSKNHDTEQMFKSMVRVFKNIKRQLVERHGLDPKKAPSYFVENLVYNCTSHCFDGGHSNSLLAIIQYWLDAAQNGQLAHFMCANEQHPLFGTGSHTWDILEATDFIIKVSKYHLGTL